MVHAGINHTDRQPQPVVQLAHLRGVATCQVVIDGDHMHALAFQRIEVHRAGGGQRLAFAGAHFRDLARMQHHAADQLHIEMAHAEHAHRGFAADRKCFGQQLVQRFAFADTGAELVGLGFQRVIR